MVATTGGGDTMVAQVLAVQPSSLVTVTQYVPWVNPVIGNTDVAEEPDRLPEPDILQV